MNVIMALSLNNPDQCTKFRAGSKNVNVNKDSFRKTTFTELIVWFTRSFLCQKTRQLLITVKHERLTGSAAVDGYSQEAPREACIAVFGKIKIKRKPIQLSHIEELQTQYVY